MAYREAWVRRAHVCTVVAGLGALTHGAAPAPPAALCRRHQTKRTPGTEVRGPHRRLRRPRQLLMCCHLGTLDYRALMCWSRPRAASRVRAGTPHSAKQRVACRLALTSRQLQLRVPEQQGPPNLQTHWSTAGHTPGHPE